MTEAPNSFSELLEEILAEYDVTVTNTANGELTVQVPVAYWQTVARILRDDERLHFEQLTDLCGVDYLSYGNDEWETEQVTNAGFSRGIDALGPGRFDWQQRPEVEDFPERFGITLHILSIEHNRRLRLRTHPEGDVMPMAPSLVEIWNAANWFEREAFDLFGIVFEGHPDLRRLLTDYGFVGHPFRKDFPLIGNVTVRYAEDKQRVVYEPVEIEPRVTVPRVVRRDSRYLETSTEQDA